MLRAPRNNDAALRIASRRLTIGGATFNTVTGTYMVATQGDFNGERPVGYKVTGTAQAK